METKKRDILRVDGVSMELREMLKKESVNLLGRENESAIVRKILADYFIKRELQKDIIAIADSDLCECEEVHRIEIRLAKKVGDKLNERAESRFMKRNPYIQHLIYADLGKPQLLNDEIEVLRKSNYELTKIGTNLNQIAKAFNTLIQMKGGDKMPEIGKKMASLRRDIVEHTGKVLRVLKQKTISKEAVKAKGKGNKS